MKNNAIKDRSFELAVEVVFNDFCQGRRPFFDGIASYHQANGP
jgi:hypothetical protein